MRFLLSLVFVLGCKNAGITYMHAFDPDSPCDALKTEVWESKNDLVICRSRGHFWQCTGGNCKDLGAIPPERQTSMSPCK